MQAFGNNVDESRFDAYVDGAVAGSVYYRMKSNQLWLIDTTVQDDYGDMGVDIWLISRVLADAHRRRLAVLPFCRQVRKMLRSDPTYRHLVPAMHRQRFGLPLTGAEQFVALQRSAHNTAGETAMRQVV